YFDVLRSKLKLDVLNGCLVSRGAVQPTGLMNHPEMMTIEWSNGGGSDVSLDRNDYSIADLRRRGRGADAGVGLTCRSKWIRKAASPLPNHVADREPFGSGCSSDGGGLSKRRYADSDF